MTEIRAHTSLTTQVREAVSSQRPLVTQLAVRPVEYARQAF